MPPPQCPSDRPRPRPADCAKRPPSLTAVALAPTKKIARPTSAPSLAALSAAARPRPPPSASAKAGASATPPDKKTTPRPLPTPQPRGGQLMATAPPSAPAASRPSNSSHAAVAPARNGAACARKPAAFMAPRGAETVRPARRLAPGTAVYVRTAYKPSNIKCRILLWLPARVVSSSDAYHCTVKYAASLNDMFAGKIVSKPVQEVRVAPQRKPEPRKSTAPAPETKAPAL